MIPALLDAVCIIFKIPLYVKGVFFPAFGGKTRQSWRGFLPQY
jgi:hypothetical protein